MNIRIKLILVIYIGIALYGCSAAYKAKIVDLAYPEVSGGKKFWKGDIALKKSFERYWSIRYDKKIPLKEVFLMEVPYFQEMVDEVRYNVYIRGGALSDLIEIQLLRIVKQSDALYRVDCRLWFKKTNGEKQDVFIEDLWVCVHGKWYHVLKDMLFLPDVS